MKRKVKEMVQLMYIRGIYELVSRNGLRDSIDRGVRVCSVKSSHVYSRVRRGYKGLFYKCYVRRFAKQIVETEVFTKVILSKFKEIKIRSRKRRKKFKSMGKGRIELRNE